MLKNPLPEPLSSADLTAGMSHPLQEDQRFAALNIVCGFCV
jgi:hypothetical protein